MIYFVISVTPEDHFRKTRMDNLHKLLTLLSKGSEKAFDQIFMAYFPRLRFFLSGILADDHEAENIAQDIFCRIWQNRSKAADIRDFNAYLFRMAKNAALNYIERNNLHNHFVEISVQKGLSRYSEEADEVLILNEIQQAIDSAIEKMPPQRRDIFRMSRIEGLSNDEIARLLMISKRTVETHISAALSDLRKGTKDYTVN